MSVFTPAGSGGGLPPTITIEGVTSPQIDNISLLLAATEYPIALPANTKRFLVKARNGGILKFRYMSGGDFLTIPYGTFLSEDDMQVTTFTVYIESNVPSQVLELITWR